MTDPIPGYADALAELDAILRELEGSDVDVDHLADRVARASTLIGVCREKISAAQLRIEQVTADLDTSEDTGIDTGIDTDTTGQGSDERQ